MHACDVLHPLIAARAVNISVLSKTIACIDWRVCQSASKRTRNLCGESTEIIHSPTAIVIVDERAASEGDPSSPTHGGFMFVQSKDEFVQENRQKSEWTEPTIVENKVESVRATRVNAGSSPAVESPHLAGAQGLAAIFGLDIRAATLAIIVDLMVFSGDAISMGILIPLGIGVAGVLSFIVFKIQRLWSCDSYESAIIKAMIVGILTAIPFPLTPLVAIPAGILGIVSAVRRNK
jgi:hypothetical protein